MTLAPAKQRRKLGDPPYLAGVNWVMPDDPLMPHLPDDEIERDLRKAFEEAEQSVRDESAKAPPEEDPAIAQGMAVTGADDETGLSADARFKKIREDLAAMDLPDVPQDEVDRITHGIGAVPLPDSAEFEGRLKDIEDRARKARQVKEEAHRGDEKEARFSPTGAKHLGIGMAIAYAIMGLPLLGAGIGWLIDRAFHVTGWIPWCTLVACTAAVVYSILLIQRSNREP